MSDEAELLGHRRSWSLRERFRLVRNAPLLTLPTGQVIDLLSLVVDHHYAERRGVWQVMDIGVGGRVVDGDGFRGEEVEYTYEIDEYPLLERAAEVGVPQWLTDLVSSRLPALPKPPEA